MPNRTQKELLMGDNQWNGPAETDKRNDPILVEAWHNTLIYGPDTETGKHARNLLRENFGEDQVTLAEDMRAIAQEKRTLG